MPVLGDEFRAAREARHLSLADVSEQIHIRPVYLQSIEEEDWSAGAAPVYIRGFIRTYARFLRLDAERAVASFNAAVGETAESSRPQALAPAGRSRRSFSPLLWVAGVAALFLVAFVVYEYMQLPPAAIATSAVPKPKKTVLGAATPEPAPAAASPEASAEAVASPEASGDAVASPEASGDASATGAPGGASMPALPPGEKPLAAVKTLGLRIAARSWLSVTVDGKAVFEGTLERGATREFHGGSAHVIAGNAGGVAVTVNGVDKGKMGNSGQVVERTYSLAGV